MHLCYMDESGTPEVPGTSSHFVLVGIAIPAWHWKAADADISRILSGWRLLDAEVHTAWMLRPYAEQLAIHNFGGMGKGARESAVTRERAAKLLQLQSSRNPKAYRQAKKNYDKTAAYIHLTQAERRQVIQQIADKIGSWGFCRLFADVIDKLHFDPNLNARPIGETAFEQIVSRFEQFLRTTQTPPQQYGMLVHDNNETIAYKHTAMLRLFQKTGTPWTNVEHIMETPMFVDSRLTRMVQVADLCSYALRRYVENGETDLFHRIFPRADTRNGKVVGVRHFTKHSCNCEICAAHR
jgi:hypothetical protein